MCLFPLPLWIEDFFTQYYKSTSAKVLVKWAFYTKNIDFSPPVVSEPQKILQPDFLPVVILIPTHFYTTLNIFGKQLEMLHSSKVLISLKSLILYIKQA